MRYPLAEMSKRAGKRKALTTFRPIATTKAQANDLAAINRRILAPWLTSRERITEAYSRELARILTTDSIDDLAALFDDLAGQVERLVLELTPTMRDWAFRVESYHRRRWASTVLAGANVDVSYLIGPQDAQEAISTVLVRNTALVKDTAAQVQGKIADAVYRGLQARTPAREVGKQIAEATGLARKRADRVAADQAVKLGAALDAQRQREAGLDVIRWNSSHKLHPRKWHAERDGRYFDIDTGQERIFEGGKQRSGPETVATSDRCGIPPFCGCVASAVLVIDGLVL